MLVLLANQPNDVSVVVRLVWLRRMEALISLKCQVGHSEIYSDDWDDLNFALSHEIREVRVSLSFKRAKYYGLSETLPIASY